MRLLLASALLAPAVLALAPCDATIPGWWQHATEVMNASWCREPRMWTASLPTGRYINVTTSGDNTTVVGSWSDGHHASGNLSSDCAAISWDDGSSWTALPRVPKIRVHISPHSHQDVGWGETLMQYYFGTGPYPATIRNVTRIISLVIKGLLENPARRFSYVEQAYMQLYWASASPAQQADIRQLVVSKQLVFLNGGWSMHDEAAPSYVDMLDNTALGHRHIADEFGVQALPTIGWQIDPFGHSAFQSVLSSPLGGVQGVMWGREPADFKAACVPKRALERVWLPSPSLGARAATFGASFFDPGYDWPSYNRCTSLSNASQCTHEQGFRDAQEFGASEIYGQRIRTVRGDDVLINWGTDYAYINAVMEEGDPRGAVFEYADGFIAGLNADPEQRFEAFYSTAADYVASKLAENLTLPALVTDLFPYGDTHAMWTGYYTSRPSFKRFVRESSSVLQSARQLQALVGGVADVGPTNSLFALERALGVAQHHDAISGTALQNVNDDYCSQLASGRASAFAGISEAFAAATGYTGAPFAPCELTNVTLCEPLEVGQPTVVIVYNALGQALAAAPIRVSAGFSPGVASWSVFDADGANVTAQLVPLSPRDAALRRLYNASSTEVQWLCFTGALPPAGFAAFFLIPSNATDGAPFTVPSTITRLPPRVDGNITNGRVTLTISASSGLVSSYADAETGIVLPLTQTWAAYEGFDGSSSLNGSTEASGAYIFRPAKPEPDDIPLDADTPIALIVGPVLSEAQSTLAYVSQVTRLWRGGDGSVEIEFTVGPVDVTGNTSREVITRYSSGLASGGAWRSDSNCRESQQRKRNARGNWSAVIDEAVAANYVPAACLVSLSSSAVTLAVAVDSAQGTTSLVDGQLELMVHRRMMHLDGREPLRRELPLNEPGVDGRGLIIRGRHWLVAAPAASAATPMKGLAQYALTMPHTITSYAGVQLSPQTWVASFHSRVSLLRAPLPLNVHLATVQVLTPDTWLLRLAHTYEVGEDDVLSQSARVDLATLFSTATITAAVDMTLPGALPLADVMKTTYRTEGGLVVTLPLLPEPPSGPALTVILAPMEVRTLRVTVTRSD